jgi:hypothetical protein
MSAPQLICILLSKFPTPLPDNLIGHDDIADEEKFLHIAAAQAEAVVEPDSVANDLGRETVVLVAVRCG